MLETGEIDALLSAQTPPSLLRGSKKVRRLFVDYEFGRARLLHSHRNLSDYAYDCHSEFCLPQTSLDRAVSAKGIRRGKAKDNAVLSGCRALDA